MKKSYFLASLILLLIATAFHSCKKNSAEEQYTETVPPVVPDLSTQIYASVSGFVTDENGNGVEAASVKAGTLTTTTDAFGYFKIPTTTFAASAGFVVVSKTGYFNGIKTFLPVTSKENFVRMQLIPKIITGNCNSSAGGTVSTADGASVTLPADAVVLASNNTGYSGTVNVAMHWLNPSNQDLLQLTMPGDLRAIDSIGHLNWLTTYGMVAVELTGDAGQLLQIAPGKKAFLNFPVATGYQPDAPATLPLWYFNESNGLWKQEGNAIKSGNTYQGYVSHFSYWNVDIANPSLVKFAAQVLNTSLQPISNALVWVSIDGEPGSTHSDYTDADGRVNGMIPGNKNLTITIGAMCNPAAYTISTFTNHDIDLGSITIEAQGYEASFTGIVNNCNGQPVTNGYVIISSGNVNHAIEIENGTFSTSAMICPNSNGYVVAVDRATDQQSTQLNTAINAGTNNFGILNACSGPVVESITYTLDGNQITVTPPQHDFVGNYYSAYDSTGISATDVISAVTAFEIGFPGAAAIGTHTMNGLITLNQLLYIPTGPIIINVTSYGPAGDFITGSTTGNTIIKDMGGVDHTFSFTFTVIRDN